MRLLYQTFLLVGLLLFLDACGSSLTTTSESTKEAPVVIANDSLEYEIIIIDLGFTLFLNTIAQPEGYYSQQFLASRNAIFVSNWNYRAQHPALFDGTIYENVIDYQPTIDYGYEVNYKLFNYFMFAQQKYKMNLGVSGKFNR